MLLMSCLALGLASQQVSAQAEVLVSNIGQTSSGSVNVAATTSFTQGFETGSHANGYDLASIDANVQDIPSTPAGVTVSIYTRSGTRPGTSVYTLTNPATFAVGTNTFSAPAGAQLDANTFYFVVVEYSQTGIDFKVGRTASHAEDSAAAGWSIDDMRIQGVPGTWGSSSSNPLLITVNGSPVPDAPSIIQIEFTSNPGVDDTYGIEDDVEVTVTFSTQITVDGTPQLTLNVGTGTKTLDCAAHATALTNLVCSYEVAENDADRHRRHLHRGEQPDAQRRNHHVSRRDDQR